VRRAARLLAAVTACALLVPAAREAAAQDVSARPTSGNAGKPVKGGKKAPLVNGAADTTTDQAQAGDDTLPPPPKVEDPMLTPLPAPHRLVATWEDVLDLVRARSTDLRIAFDEVEKAEGQSRIALAGALTQLNGTGSLTHNFLQGTYPISATSNLSYPTKNVAAAQLGLIQPVIAPRAWYAIGTAHRAADAARMSLEDRKRILATDVAGALVAEIAAERIAELNRVGLRQALERLQLAHRREDLGSGTKLDVVRAEQDVDTARASLVTGDESARQDREALGLALGLPEQVGAAPGLNIDGLVNDTGTGCKLVTTVDSRADLRSLHTQVDVAARGVKDVWYQFSPSVNLQSTLSYSNDALAIPNTTWNIQGVLTVPLWDGGARYGELRQAKAQKDEAEQNLIAARRNVIIQIEQARRNVSVAEDSRKVAVDGEMHAQQVDHMTQVGFLTGQGTSLDLVISAAGLRQAQINRALRDFDLVRARIDALLALADCQW
jgi:multidrug efflux system outer membrane protein